jgi:hypothetical protein
MNKERYNRIIDDAYKNFKNNFPMKKSNPPKDYINSKGQLLTKEEFINKIKTDDEFSEKWGLKIDERELDMFERWKIADLTPNMTEFDYCNKLCDEHNVPTKLITVTYNGEIIESYNN